MRKSIIAAAAIATFSSAAMAQQSPMSQGDHGPVVKQYELKDGNTLYVFKDGRMAMENKFGKAASMKDGHPMETKDGQKIMMKGNELWRVEQHKVTAP